MRNLINLAAAKGGHTSVLKHWRGKTKAKSLFLRAACEEAAKGGHLETLKYLRSEGAPWKPQDICSWACQGGNFELLQWVTSQDGVQLNPYACTFRAASGGHLHILKWLRKEKCSEQFKWIHYAAANAARGGHLEVLRWFVILFFSLAAFFDLASDPAILPSKGCERRAAPGKAKPWTQQQDEATLRCFNG